MGSQPEQWARVRSDGRRATSGDDDGKAAAAGMREREAPSTRQHHQENGSTRGGAEKIPYALGREACVAARRDRLDHRRRNRNRRVADELDDALGVGPEMTRGGGVDDSAQPPPERDRAEQRERNEEGPRRAT